MFSRLKGYFKRYSAPRPDKNYKPKETTYGDYDVMFISSTVFDNIANTNIIMAYTYDKNPEKDDILKEVEEFEFMLKENRFGMKTVYNNGRPFIFFAGNRVQYATLINYYYNDPDYRYNKLLCLLRQITANLDIVSTLIGNEASLYYQYESEILKLDPTNPVVIQSIDISNIPYELQNDKYLFDNIKSLIKLGYLQHLNEQGEYHYHYDYILDFLTNFYYGKNKGLEELKLNFKSNFNIKGFKNIFDINFKVTIDNDESYYEDIDEVI